jgi:O-antigen/teichoic acid export membrane protein
VSSGKRNARNLAINWMSFVASGVVMFLLSPFVINSLGAVEYGIWSLLNVLTGYMGILDVGIRASTGRHVFLYIGKEDHQAVDETIRTGLGFYSVLGFLILLVAALIGLVFPSVFVSVPAEYRPMLLWLVPLMAVNVWFSAFSSVFSSVLVAHERFDMARGVDFFTLLVRTVGTIVVLYMGFGIIGLALVVVASNIIPVVCNAWLGKRVYPQLRFWPLQMHRERMRELMTYGIGSFIATAGVKIIGQTDLLIVGIAIDVSAVTVYSVGAMIVYYSHQLTKQINRTFQPSLQKAVARGEMGSARWIVFRQVRLACLIGIPVYVGFIIYAESFIRLWMLGPNFGESSVRSAATVMQILAGAKLLNLFYMGAGPLLWAMGRVRFSASIAMGEALTNLGLSLVFVLFMNYGLWGVALGTFVSRLVVMTFVMPWYACRAAGINFGSYVLQIGGRGSVAIGLFACWCFVAQIMIPCDTWMTFAASVAFSLIGFLPIGLLLLLPESDRSRLWGMLRGYTAQAG